MEKSMWTLAVKEEIGGIIFYVKPWMMSSIWLKKKSEVCSRLRDKVAKNDSSICKTITKH